ncbi:hypothetical protein Cadr_000005822 [Camelus dromedarius]|uniref:Uncharacterized protein n=1 Tax=Camelus dromedarius TaxID=9838 RepID=A0A5N4E448_CAMDR|nr:hypothetical protein Cadr_000005822 [Camelus dromedarius]
MPMTSCYCRWKETSAILSPSWRNMFSPPTATSPFPPLPSWPPTCPGAQGDSGGPLVWTMWPRALSPMDKMMGPLHGPAPKFKFPALDKEKP